MSEANNSNEDSKRSDEYITKKDIVWYSIGLALIFACVVFLAWTILGYRFDTLKITNTVYKEAIVKMQKSQSNTQKEINVLKIRIDVLKTRTEKSEEQLVKLNDLITPISTATAEVNFGAIDTAFRVLAEINNEQQLTIDRVNDTLYLQGNVLHKITNELVTIRKTARGG